MPAPPPAAPPPPLTGAALAAHVRRHDPDRFLATLFAPATAREVLWLVLALNHELARAREAASHPLAALIRLQWWRDAVADGAAGRPRRHELAGPLGRAVGEGLLPADTLVALADAREAETEERVPDLPAFLAYLRGTAGGVAALSGRLLGADAAGQAALREIGAAYGLAGVLRAVPWQARAGRCLLPADLLAAHGLSPEAVAADPRTPALAPVTTALAAEGAALLAAGRAAAGGLARGAVAAALPGVLAGRDLAALRAGRPPRPAGRGIGDRLAVLRAGWRSRI